MLSTRRFDRLRKRVSRRIDNLLDIDTDPVPFYPDDWQQSGVARSFCFLAFVFTIVVAISWVGLRVAVGLVGF